MPERDLYETLGIRKGASEQEIKRAYRKLAKKYHPDTNPGNRAAEQKFKEVTEAYNILSDPQKRKLYDQFGMAAFDGSMENGGFREYHDSSQNQEDMFGDIFENFFRQGSFHSHFGRGFQEDSSEHFRKKNSYADITIDFEEAAFGCDKILQVDGYKRERLKVHIPAGINEGQSVRLKGKGVAGDLLIRVHIQEKPGYRREGRDVYVTESIPYTTAALGGTARFRTLYGPVECKIPPGTQPGSKIRIRNKGIVAMSDPKVYGDEYVTIQIQVPKTVTPEEKRIMEELKKAAGL